MELTAADYAAVLRRRLPVLVLVVALFGLIAYAMQSSAEPRYSATTEVFLNPIIDPVSNTPQVSKRDTLVNMDTERRLATSVAVAEQFRDKLEIGDESARQLRGHVVTTAVPETELLLITYNAATPETATDRSLAWAVEYLALRKATVESNRREIADSLQTQIDVATADLAAISTEIADLPPDSADRFSAEARREAKQRLLTALQESLVMVTSASTNTGTVVNAPSSARAVQPFGRREIIAVLFAGLLIGIALAFVLDRADRRIRRADDIALAGVPVLGEFTKNAYDAGVASRARSMLAGGDEPGGIILVASTDDPAAGAVVALHLARAYAAADRKVAIIATDADRPEVERMLGVSSTPGVSDVVVGGHNLAAAMRSVEVPVGALAVLGSGDPNRWRPGMLACRDAHEMVESLAARVDVVIVLAAPLDVSSTALDLAPIADRGVLAIRRNSSSATKFAKGLAELRKLELDVAGVVLVGRK